VLVVDDDPDALDIYRQYLSFVGMNVETARDGMEAIQRAQMHVPDVIVMDISMPFIEGDDAAALLKQDARTRAIPIIGVSAFGGLARSKGRHVAFEAYHVKPLLPERLAAIIRAVLSDARRAQPVTAKAHSRLHSKHLRRPGRQSRRVR
jgi:two-component system, cell cycle response regulator DivK